jgi:hypothetical protein
MVNYNKMYAVGYKTKPTIIKAVRRRLPHLDIQPTPWEELEIGDSFQVSPCAVRATKTSATQYKLNTRGGDASTVGGKVYPAHTRDVFHLEVSTSTHVLP